MAPGFFRLSAIVSGLLLFNGCSAIEPTQLRSSSPPVAQAWKAFIGAAPGQQPFVDFSRAGVFYGDKAIPDISGWRKFHVRDFGAVPDDSVDDGDAIQRTIKAAEAAGGGVVSFDPGRYVLNSDPAKGSIRVSTSRIVLKGSDQGKTVLFMAKPQLPTDPDKIWTGRPMVLFSPAEGVDFQTKVAVIGRSEIGSMQVAVADARKFTAGDYVAFDMQSTRANAQFLHGKPVRDIWQDIRENGVALHEIHRIKSVSDGVLHLEQPLLSPIDPSLPWTVSKRVMIEQVGFENIDFDGNFTDPFEHHKNATHDSGHQAIGMTRTVDSWVRNNTFRNVSAAIVFTDGLANSALLNQIEGNPGHFAIQSELSTRNLIGLNIDRTPGGQLHGPSVAHKSVGTVIWRYLSPTGRGVDLHANSPRNTLFDLVEAAGFGSWGGNYVNLPNHLDGLVFWNVHQTGPEVGAFYDGTLDFWQFPDNPSEKWTFLTAVDPIIVGYKGPITSVNPQNVAFVESLGGFVSPHSLYEAQLEHQLGKRPRWLNDGLAEWGRIVDQKQ